jgi:hypothetical protein
VALFANRLREAKTQQTALQEVNAKANVIYAEQTAKLNSLVAIIKSSATSDDTKKKTLQQLTEAHKEYSSVLKNNTIDVVELDRVTKQLTDSIRLQAETTASAQLLAEKSAKVVEVQSARQLIESAIATGQKDLTADLSKAQQEIIKSFGSAKSQLLPTSQGGIKLFEGTFGGGVPLDPKQVLASLKKLEDERITGVQQFQKINDKAQKDLDAYLKSQATSTAGFEVDIKTLRTKIETLDKEIQDFQGSKADLEKKKKERDALQKQLDELTKTTPTKAAGPSQLSAEVKDSLKDVEAIRDELLAKEELRRQQNLEDEEAYLKNVLLINEVAIDKKLQLIKGDNAEERKTIAQLNLEKLKLIQETNDKIFDIRQKALKEQLDQQIAAIELQRDEQLLDPNLTETQRADIKLAADRKILDLQVAYNDAINRLEKQLAQQSLANTKEGAEAIKKTKQAILLDEKAQTEAALKDEQIAGERSVVEFKNLISKLKLAIVQDTELSPQRRTQLLTVAQGQENIGILAREVDSLQKQLPIYKQLLAEKVITDQQYQEFETQLNQKQLELNDALVKGIAGNIDQVKKFYKDLLDAGLLTKEAYDKLISDLNNTTSKGVQKATQSIKSLKDILTTGIANLFNIDTSTDKGKLLSGAIAEALVKTYQLATTAMTNYYNAERERIQQNLQLQEDRLDKEKEQVEARAQSQAEIDSIEKQYAAKKKKAQQQAGEDLKRTKRSEAKIALASELINIAVQASQYPFPASLIIGGILAAAALANYSIQIGAINREQFKWGGMPGQKQKSGGAKGPASFIKRIFSIGGQPGSSGGGRRQATVIKFDKGGQPAGSKKLGGITSSQPIIAATSPAFVPATAMTTATEYPAPYVKQKNVVREIWTGIQRIFKLGGQPGKTKAKDSRESSLHTIEQTTRRNLNDDTAVHRVVSIEDGTPIDETTELPSPADKKQTFIQRVFTRIRKFAFGGQPGKQGKDSKQETSQRLINETTQIIRDNKLKETNITDISSSTHANTDSSSAASTSTNTSSSTSREEKADSSLAVNTHITRDNDISETNRSQKSTSAEETHKRKKNYLRERIITSVQKFFSFGGRPGDVPIRGGEFGGRPHSQGGTDFEFEGNRYNAEAKEVAVIRTRNAPVNKIYQIIGTQMQIASAANRIGGGVDFRPGAKIKHFATGGVLGSNLQAPIYVPSSSGQASNDAIVKELKSIQAKLDQNTTVHRQLADEQSRRVDDIEVNVVVGKVTKAQKEASIKSTIGTLS